MTGILGIIGETMPYMQTVRRIFLFRLSLINSGLAGKKRLVHERSVNERSN